jgi:hypothetical protein
VAGQEGAVLRLYELVGPLVFVFWLYCLFEAILTREDEVRNLGKGFWIVIVLFFPLVGSVAWFVAGRPLRQPRSASPYERPASEFPEYDRPGRAAGVTQESDEEFLRRVRERAEEQRRRAAEEKRRREQEPE